MAMRREEGRGPAPARRYTRVFTKRGLIVAATLVGAAVATVVAASATTHPSPSQQSVERSAPQQRSALGSGRTSGAAVRARTAVRGHLPRAVKRFRPQQLHLEAAHGKVFDVRKLKGAVVRKERPERIAPGFAPEGTLAAEALERPARVSPQLPSVIEQSEMISAAAPAPDSSFDGLDFANWGAGHPPDENGDVGPTYYIQTVNTSIGIYDKSSGNRVAAFTFNAFMSQGHFGNLCDTDNFGDPVVLYDSYENRWFITDFAFKLDASGNVVNPPGAFQCFAVSKTGDPVNGGWNFYSIGAPGALNDYPKFGVWPDGIYMSANMFGYAAGGSYQGYHVWALNKQQMYAGAPSPQVVDFSGDTSDFTVIPANSRLQAGVPPTGEPEFFVSTEQFLNGLSIYKFHVDWDKPSTSTFTGPQTQLAPNCWPNATPANASTPANAADVLAIRAMAQAQYSNVGGAESLWVDHTVNRGTFATANCGGTNTNNATVRWYQANVTGGTVAANVVQGATYDPEGANTFFRFMPSLAVDRVGDMAVGYTKSNATTNPQIKYAGRLAGDPANTLGQSEQTLINGTGAQSGNCGGAACVRWGDYSGMSLDPNGCEFWMTGEYFATTGLNDLTRIGSFKLNPACSPVGNGTLSGTVTDGTSPIAGATVALGSRTTTTDGSGNYSFTVPAGTYASLSASKAGFDDGSASTIAVPDGGAVTRNFTLSAAAQSGCFTDNTQATFQRGLPSNCDLVSSPGSVVLASPDNTDAKNDSVTGNGFGFTNTSWAGQTFTPTVSGQLKRVDVELFCASCSATSPNVTLSIRNTSGSVPTGADLATATLAGFNDGGAGGLKTFSFASPVTLTAGTRYAFTFRLASAFASGTVAYTCSCTPNSNPYANGQFVTSTNSGSTWTADPTSGGRDLSFVTYINPGFASSGTYVSSLKDANPAAGRTAQWTTLAFAATQPAGTAVKFQVAGSNSPYGPFSFVGPDGTAGTFFTTSGASLSQFDGFRYLKYKAYLATSSGSVTPTLSSVQVCYDDTAATAATALAVAPAAGTYGGTTTLSATLTSAGNPVPNETVHFSLNGSSVGGAITNGSGVATLANVSLAGVGAGSHATAVSASFPGDGSFGPSSGSSSLTVSPADQAISVTTHAPLAAVFNGQFTVAATGGGSGNAVTFSSSGACTNSGATFTMTSGTGTCSVKYDQAGSANYNAAPQVVESVSAQKADQTINVTTHAPSAAPFDADFTVAATAPGGAVSFSSAGSCTNAGATYTITVASGTCSVEYDQGGSANYNPAPQVVESVIAGKQAQSITITHHAPATAVYGSGFSVAATGGGSGNPVRFSSSGACTNSGADFTMTSGTGTCTVMFDQAGDGQYADAPEVTETVNAAKANQAIVITLHAPFSAPYATGFSVAASGGGSGNPVTFSSSGVCSHTAGTFTMTSGTGTCSVKFDQAGDANYNAAPQLSETTTAQKAGQTVTFGALPDRSVGDPDFAVSATASSGLSVSLAASGQCTLSGATVHLTGAGSCTITASQGGDSNYAAAPAVPRTFQITAARSSSQITDTTATCAQFGAGTAPTLGTVFYTSKGGKLNKETPGKLTYWVKLTVAAGAHHVEVDQTITTGNFSRKLDLTAGSLVFTSACGKVRSPTIAAGASGSVTVDFTAAAGTYYVAVRYLVSAVNGQAEPNPTTIHYDFTAAAVSGSTSGLDLKKTLAAAPGRAVRAALFRALRH
jgi:carboxypeptidase family protein